MKKFIRRYSLWFSTSVATLLLFAMTSVHAVV